MNKGKKILVLLLQMCMLLAFSGAQVLAETNDTNATKAVVFLLDASASMKENDRDRLAIDSIGQLVYSLPSDYVVGVVAYSQQVVCAVELEGTAGRTQVVEAVDSINYSGYTNAGEGLAKAVELLERTDAAEKTIIMLSDGEIDMRTSGEIAVSQEQFQMAVNYAADQGILIHVIGLGLGLEDLGADVFSAAESTNGVRMQITDANEVPAVIEEILTNQLQVKKRTVALVEVSGGIDDLSVPIPFQYADTIRILLTGTGVIQNLSSDFDGSDARQYTGNYYALVEISNPAVESINVHIQGQAGSQIKVDILPEYRIVSVPEQFRAEYMEHEADPTAALSVCFFQAGNPNQQVFTEDIFEHTSVRVGAGDEWIETAFTGGVLNFELPVGGVQQLPLIFDFTDVPVNVLGESTATLYAEMKKAPVPVDPPAVVEQPKKDIRPLVILGIAMLVTAVSGVILRSHRSGRTLSESSVPTRSGFEPAGKYSFTGRLSIRIKKTGTGHDIEPLSYNLFRLSSNREISLQQILEGCGVEEPFAGAGKILFQPGEERGLVLTNRSDCTIMRDQRILLKGKRHHLPVNAKVEIVFEDERSELAFRYRELKPV